MKTITIGDYEYETELHTDMDRLYKIKIPEGWELLEFQDFMNIWNDEELRKQFDYNGDGFNEVIINPLVEARKNYPYWNLWLARRGNVSVVDGFNRNQNYSDSVRGVRFKRKIK